MEANNKSYFGEIGDALKSLATGLKVTLKEYFTKKSTEQYPENRKTTLHVAQRHRGRDKLVLHLDKEHYESSLPNILDGGAPLTIGKFNTATK